MSKRVGVFSLAFEPFVGGAEIAVKEIATRISDSNFTIFTKRFDRRWPALHEKGNLSIIRLGFGKRSRNYYGNFLGKIFYIWQAWRTAERLHRQNPFELIWAIMASYAGFAALLFKLRHPRVPFVLTVQEGDSEAHILKRVGLFYPFWRKIFTNADSIQAISNYLADFAKRHGARCPIEVIPNGVDLKAYQVSDIRYQAQAKPKIITTSRLVKKNGIDVLIRAVAELPSVTLQILGDGPERHSLELLAENLSIKDRIEFVGQVEPDKISNYLSQATIFVRPSRSEGLGNSFLEAMAAGLPVIGTPVGGIPDFLKDGETGLFCKADDPKDLAAKIDLLVNDGNLCQRLGSAGRGLVLREYSWGNIAEKMSSIFQSL